MNINNFSDLTDFLYNEHDKLSESLGVVNASPSFTRFSERSLMRYAKIYDKPLLRRAKRELRIQIAIDTMPHNFIWKIFHKRLWKQCLIKLGHEQGYKPPKPKKAPEKSVYPVVVQSRDISQVADPPK